MSILPGPSNAIVYAQFNIQGRWWRMLSVAGGYAAIIGAGMWITAATVDRADSLQVWAGLICGLQFLNLMVFGAFRVESAVRGDVTSRMLESHRLMPMPPLASILGYIFGAPLQSILLTAVNFLLGAVCCAQSGLSLIAWATANGVFFFFSICVYAVLVQFAFVTRGGFLLLLVAGGFAVALAANEGMEMLPAVGVLLNPLLARNSVIPMLFDSPRRGADVSDQYAIALAAQAVIALVAIRAAVRRYLSSTTAGISDRLGLMLLALWVSLIVVQHHLPTWFLYSYRDYRNDNDAAAQMVVAFATSMLIALLPIGSAAWTARQAQRAGDPSAVKPKIRSTEILTVLAASAIVCALLMDFSPLLAEKVVRRGWTEPARALLAYEWGWTIMIVVIFLASIGLLFSWGYLIRKRAWVFVCIWVLITWMVPIAADGIYRNVTNDRSDATLLTAFSPPGALALIWSNSTVAVLPGIVGQVLLSVVPTGILLFTQSRHAKYQKDPRPRTEPTTAV